MGKWAGSYYCTEEETAGLHFDQSSRHWAGTVFNPTERFVLAMSYMSPSSV